MEHRQEQTLEQRQHHSYHLAGFWVRAVAFVLDLVVVSAFTSLLLVPLFSFGGMDELPAHFLVTASYIGLVAALYFILMTKISGQTLGKMIMGLRVITGNGQDLSWSNVLFREGIGRFLSQALGLHLGYVWVAFHPRKQGWHDQIDGTLVIYEQEVVAKHRIEVDD